MRRHDPGRLTYLPAWGSDVEDALSTWDTNIQGLYPPRALRAVAPPLLPELRGED
jgi:hypothetical protein